MPVLMSRSCYAREFPHRITTVLSTTPTVACLREWRLAEDFWADAKSMQVL